MKAIFFAGLSVLALAIWRQRQRETFHVSVCAIGGRPLGAADREPGREVVESSMAYIKARRSVNGGAR